jgi:predicted RNase H-like HicB family nuclease
MTHRYTIPLMLAAQLEGGYIVTSPALTESITEGDTVEETLTHTPDALDGAV